MIKKIKVISGLKSGNNIIRKPSKYFTDSEKCHIIEEYLASGTTKREIWEKYTGQTTEHGSLLRWMRQFGYSDIRVNFISANQSTMSQYKKSKEQLSEDFETLQLKKRIAELESQLKDAEMKAIAYSTMVDIAEKQFNIPIRKKYNTKPSKS